MANQKERPILFSGPMVRAILAGQKTQTRRVVKPQPPTVIGVVGPRKRLRFEPVALPDDFDAAAVCPYGKPGDRLWVRETWAIGRIYDGVAPNEIPLDALPKVAYPASQDLVSLRLRPSIHMPRWASRILLEIVSVRVERVQQIDHAGAVAEGVVSAWGARQIEMRDGLRATPSVHAFAALWDEINSKRGYGWDVNPWVWVIEFKVLEGATNG